MEICGDDEAAQKLRRDMPKSRLVKFPRAGVAVFRDESLRVCDFGSVRISLQRGDPPVSRCFFYFVVFSGSGL